jgi:hypothetical protein
MIDWEHIAELLTEKWYAEGKLPLYHDNGLQYDYIFSTAFTGFPDQYLGYARTELTEATKQNPIIKVTGSILKSDALREVWSLLTEPEKIAIMADTLGAHVHD